MDVRQWAAREKVHQQKGGSQAPPGQKESKHLIHSKTEAGTQIDAIRASGSMWIFLLLLLGRSRLFRQHLARRSGSTAHNNLPVARARLEEASRIQPASPQAWMGLAQTYWKLKLPDLARTAAAKAESAAPDSPVVLHGLAYFYSETGDPARAASLEARYAEKTPRGP